MMNVLQIRVSCFENFSTTNKPILTTIGKLLDCIRSGGKKVANQIYQIRCAKDDATRKSLKRNLPMAMWQGVFSNRSNNGLQSLSSVMCVDIDHIPQALDGLKLQLQDEPWVLAFFTSPSGDGLKVLVKTDCYSPAYYTQCYQQLEDLFMQRYGIKVDHAGATLGQACYMSYDPQLYVNPNATDYQFNYNVVVNTVAVSSSNVSNTLSQRPSPIVSQQPSYIQTFMNKLSVMGNNLTDEEIIKIFDHKQPSIVYEDGHRTNAIFRQACDLCKAGIPQDKALSYLKSRFLPTGYDSEKLTRSVVNAYTRSMALFWTERGKYKNYAHYKAQHP
jgi:hypothetical protein